MNTATAPAFTQDWFTQHVPLWTRLLAPLAGRADLRALEIGCFEGRATCWLLERVLTGPRASIDCIDTFEGSDEHPSMRVPIEGLRERFTSNVAPWRARVRLHEGRSEDVLRRLVGRYDFVYVDGSHAAADVLADAVLAWPRVGAGGLVIFDDYAWQYFRRPERNPRLGIDAFVACYAGRFRVLHRGYQVVLEKLPGYSADAAATVLAAHPSGRD